MDTNTSAQELLAKTRKPYTITRQRERWTEDEHERFLEALKLYGNLVNAIAHAAATFAASVWPYANLGNSGDSSAYMSSSQSLAAIAAVTVAAATAWWASHGLLPVCAPTPVTCLPLPTFAVVPTPAINNMDTVENDQQLLEKQSTALQDKKLSSSSDDSEETGITKLNDDSKTSGDKVVVVHDSNTGQKKKLVDRSSCGSNTPSGSDAETDALDKMEKDKEDVKVTDANLQGIVDLRATPMVILSLEFLAIL